MTKGPWHGSRFDIRSGEVVMPPAMRPESTYEIKVENNNILNGKQKVAGLIYIYKIIVAWQHIWLSLLR
jgi:Rieske Fe-S protein